MLAELQTTLSETYALDFPLDIEQFLVTDKAHASALSSAALRHGAEETLFVAECDGELLVSLYLDETLLDRLQEDNPLESLHHQNLGDFCEVIEGVSHFMCVTHRAVAERQTNLLELELQAEVDKFILSLQLAALQDDAALTRSLHSRLFEQVAFRDTLSAQETRRYQEANQLAARFCYRLQQQLIEQSDAANRALRRFFRAPIADKVSLIAEQSWQG
ncbi:MAG: hypothetical protein AAFN07_16470 [Pseudomonadota bacterium]